MLGGAGGVEAVTNSEDTTASLGQVDPGVFKVADPGFYRGPDSGKSSVPPDQQRSYFADDTGRLYYGDGSEWIPFGVNGIGIPQDNTVSAIADAVSNYTYVKLLPGVTYTHDGTSQITHDGDTDADTWVDAHKATIEVRGGPVLDVKDAGVAGGWFGWMGGDFVGSDSVGEIAMQSIDNIWSTFAPHTIQNCEVAIVFAAESNWNEGNTVRAITKNNDTGLMLLGDASDATVPSGSSVSVPTDNGGTQSLRRSEIKLWTSPRETPIAQTECFGIYESEVKPYISDFWVTVNLDTNTVGWRMHGVGYPGTKIQYHTETAGNRSGGTAIRVDKLERHPPHMTTRIGGEDITEMDNNQDLPIISWDSPLDQSGSNGIFGPKLVADGTLGDPLEQFTTARTNRSDGRGKVLKYTNAFAAEPGDDMIRYVRDDTSSDILAVEYRDAAGRLFHRSFSETVNIDYDSDINLILRNSGTSGAPAVEIGNSGAGLFVNASGELVGVDEAGNTTTLT
jgi:hypothetical protein